MNNDAYLSASLSSLAAIMAGHPFRGAVSEAASGDTCVVQLRNASAESGIDWAEVARTDIKGKRQPNWLRVGDVLFAAKGSRNFAVTVEPEAPKAVCSPHFFIIRLKNLDSVAPEFLAWQMNQVVARRYFEQSAEGAYVPNIRRQVLEGLEVMIPPLDTQRAIVELDRRHRREKQLLKRLEQNRERQMEAIALRLAGQ